MSASYYSINAGKDTHNFVPLILKHGKTYFVPFDLLPPAAQAQAQARFNPAVSSSVWRNIRNWSFPLKVNGTLAKAQAMEPCRMSEAIGTANIDWDVFWTLGQDHPARVAYNQGEQDFTTGAAWQGGDIENPIAIAYRHGYANAKLAQEDAEYQERQAPSLARTNAPI